MKKIKICIVTSSRAEYGLLKNLIKKIQLSNRFDCHLSVTGTHLRKSHGYTVNEIIKDKIKIHSKINILNRGDSNHDISESFSKGVSKYSQLFKKIKPELLLVLGDKFEIMSSAVASTLHRIPIAHIHGGEETIGSLDNALRHTLTKMAHVHFTSTKEYRSRVIQMGERPKNVFNTGAIGLENLKKIKFYDKKFFKKKYKINFERKTIIICFHPVTLEPKTENKYFKEILHSLSYFKDCNLVFSSPNADHGYLEIIKLTKKYVKKNKNAFFIKSFGRLEFISCLKLSKVILGNSSSGIIEAPSLKTFTINLGSRQMGRIQANSVFNCEINKKNMIKIIQKIINDNIKIKNNTFFNPYFKKNSTYKIINELQKLDFSKLIKKKFFKLVN